MAKATTTREQRADQKFEQAARQADRGTRPALDGHGVDVVFRHTSKLTRAECSELCEFVMAWCAEHDVTLRDSRQWSVDLETGEIT